MQIESSFVDSFHFEPESCSLVFILKGKEYAYPVKNERALDAFIELAMNLGSLGKAYHRMLELRSHEVK